MEFVLERQKREGILEYFPGSVTPEQTKSCGSRGTSSFEKQLSRLQRVPVSENCSTRFRPPPLQWPSRRAMAVGEFTKFSIN
jgi:hypothetical protein